MKTIEIYGGKGNSIKYVVNQNDNMEASAFKYEKGVSAEFSTQVYLGVIGDINDLKVREAIIAKLFPVYK